MTNAINEKRHFFDWAAGAPFDPLPELIPFGNPSSMHYEGRLAKEALEVARSRCASVLKVPAENLFFTSGGTESNSIALFSVLAKKESGRVIAPETEHSSVREGLETLENLGKAAGKINVDSLGRVTDELLSKALEKYKDVRFISCMAVNNETGAITDIASLGAVIRNLPIHFHCDLVQAAGKIPVNIEAWGIDSASISAHKIGGPRGIGLLYMRNPQNIFYTGGGQEKGVRGGTENVHGAIALAACLEKRAREEIVEEEFMRAKSRMNKLISSLVNNERCTIIPAKRTETAFENAFSPYILQCAIKNIPGEVMARALDDLGFAVSTGSACSSNSPERPVLKAMGIEERLRIEGIRISQGYSNTEEEIDLLLEAIAEVLKFL